MNEKIQNIILEILRYIIAVLIGLALIGLFGINLAQKTVLNKEYVYERLEASNYYDTLLNYTYEHFTYYIYQSGFDDTILKDIVSKEKIIEDTSIIVENVYEGTEENIQTDTIKEKLEVNIQNYLKTKNLKAEQKSLDEFSKLIINIYNGAINHSNKIEKLANNYLQKINNIIKKIKPVLIGVLVILISALVLISTKQLTKIINMSGVALLFTSIMLIVTKIFITNYINFENLDILNIAITNGLENTIKDITTRFNPVITIYLILGIIMILLGNYARAIVTEKQNRKK